jgi:ribonuclease M5
MNYKQVIVVEGTHDEQKIKSIYPNIDCIVTNGSEISTETLNLIYQTSLIRDVILFLDPDFPGKKITNEILNTKGNFKIAYINKMKALNKTNTKVGIEHCNREDIIFALNNLISLDYTRDSITRLDLLRRGFISSENSANKRSILCEKLNIPYVNGKALLRNLNMLGIKLERIDEIIDEFKS